MTFVISRAFEYEADIKSIELTSPAGLLDSLALIDMLDEYMKESFWEDYYRYSITHEKPISVFGEVLQKDDASRAILSTLSAGFEY